MKFLILLALIPLSAIAADPWSDADIARQVVAETLLVVDWGQTRCMAKSGAGCESWRNYYEQNPLLGNHPSLPRVNNYFVASMILSPLIVHYAPARWRPYIQSGQIALQIGTINHNRQIGLKVCF